MAPEPAATWCLREVFVSMLFFIFNYCDWWIFFWCV